MLSILFQLKLPMGLASIVSNSNGRSLINANGVKHKQMSGNRKVNEASKTMENCTGQLMTFPSLKAFPVKCSAEIFVVNSSMSSSDQLANSLDDYDKMHVPHDLLGC